MTKAPTPKEKYEKQRDNTPPKTSITQRLRTDLGRPVGVTTATQLVYLNRLTGSLPSHSPQQLCIREHEHAGIILQLAEISICIIFNENDTEKNILSRITTLLDVERKKKSLHQCSI